VDHKLLSIYLNDHLAGATAGRELARRVAASNRSDADGSLLQALAAEVDEDRESLLALMRTLGVGTDRVKVVAGWAGEKLGRLKLNGRLLGYSPLSRLVEIEGLLLGVRGKQKLWDALLALADEEPALDAGQLDRLQSRARRQFEQLDDCHRRAVDEAFR
jgi:hypothetical protein